jgi:transcriptional regulator with XRE-family HTH domain
MDKRILAGNLIYLRVTKSKFSQATVSDFLNIERSTYARWEMGIVSIKAEYLPELASVFNVSINILFAVDIRTELGLISNNNLQQNDYLATTQTLIRQFLFQLEQINVNEDQRNRL